MDEPASDEAVFIAVRFPNGQAAAMARDRLRRFQARQAGKIRVVVPPGPEPPVVVAGPVRGLDLQDALRLIAELDGELVSAVRPVRR